MAVADTGCDGTGRAVIAAGTRRGYHVSTVILPWYKPTPRGRETLARFVAINPDKPVVWHHRPGYSWWESRAAMERRDKLMAMVAKRTRGVRSTYRQLAGMLGISVTSLTRTVKSLVDAGAVLVTTTRGRRGRTVIRMFHHENREGGTTTSTHSSSRSMGGTFPRQAPGVTAEAPDEDRYKRGEGDWWDRLREQARLRFEEINREVPW
jgi:hypothetical protein